MFAWSKLHSLILRNDTRTFNQFVFSRSRTRKSTQFYNRSTPQSSRFTKTSPSKKRVLPSTPKNKGSNSLGTRLKHLIGPTVFTGSCICIIESVKDPLCRYLFPSPTYDDLFQQLFDQPSRRAGPLSRWWSVKTNIEKLACGIIFIHGFVFLLFRAFPAYMLPTLEKLFVAGPRLSLVAIPLAMFTHLGGLHLMVNSYALNSFASGFRVIQTPPQQFLRVYLECGILSNYIVIALKILTNSYAYSMVGASAAIYALIGYLSQAMPDQELGIIGLSHIFPALSFKLQHAPLILLGFDGGLLLMKKLSTSFAKGNPIAHEAHLVGLFLGCLFWFIWKKEWEIRKFRTI